MNQAELIAAIAAHAGNHGVTKASVKHVLDALSNVATNELKKGGEVPIPGIGKLAVKTTAARKGRNPGTGEEMDIPSKKKPAFTAAKALKDAVAK